MNEIEFREAVETDIDDMVDLWWMMQESHDKYDSRFYRNLGQEKCKKSALRYFTELLKKKLA